MKTIFKNKKHLTIVIFSVSVIMAFVIMIPTVFALSDNDGEIVENQPMQEKVIYKAEQGIVSAQEDTVSIMQEQKPTGNENVEVDVKTETRKSTEEFVKLGDEVIYIGNCKFNYNSTDENDSLFGTATKRYITEKLDSIVVDAKDNTIYKLYLSNETVLTESFRATGNSEKELKLVSDKIAAELGADVKRYNVCNVKFDSTAEKYSVRYELMINGYKTTEYISIAFDKNLNFSYYYRYPNVFDNIDISNLVIEEKAIKGLIDEKTKAKRGESFGYNEIQAMTLTVKDSKVIMLVDCIEYDKDGKRLVSNGIARTEIEIK